MKVKSETKPTKLLWLDLEMTGLDPGTDLILEVALEITDFDFKTLASYEAFVKQPTDEVVKRMAANNWWSDFPSNRDEFISRSKSGKTLDEVEADIIKLVNEQFGDDPVILAGNSIHNDRKFIEAYLPKLNLKLHYRMLDVSAFKILMQGKYDVFYDKPEVHRAFDDIQASIAELQYYLDYLKQ